MQTGFESNAKECGNFPDQEKMTKHQNVPTKTLLELWYAVKMGQLWSEKKNYIKSVEYCSYFETGSICLFHII